MLTLRSVRFHANWPQVDFVFVASLAMAFASCFSLVGTAGLIVLLLLTIVRRSSTTMAAVLIAAITSVLLLKSSGNWYAAHKATKVIIGLAALASALLSLPLPIRERFSKLSHRSLAFWCVGLPVYLFQCFNHAPLSSGDTKPVVPTVVQMLSHGNRDLAAWNDGRWKNFVNGDWPYFLRSCDGREGLYSAYPAGMELFALPASAVIALSGMDPTPGRINTAEKISARLLTAVNLALFFLLAVQYVDKLTAWTAAALLALGSAFTSTTANELWQQGGVCFWILVILHCELHGKRGWLQAFACAAMLACRPTAVSFLIPFGIWRLIENQRSALILVAQSLVCYAPWAFMYLAHYRTPFGPSMRFLQDHWVPAEHLMGVLFSPGRGLFLYQAWLLLMFVKQDWPGWKWMVLAAFLTHTLVIASWPIWWGGHCYGSRLMTEAALLGGVLILQPLQKVLSKGWGGWLVGALIIVGLIVHLPGACGNAMAWNAVPNPLDANTDRLWDWAKPPMLYDFQNE